MSKRKDKYICPICNEFTSHDEWANENSCINCGPVHTDFSKGEEKSVIKGEKGPLTHNFMSVNTYFLIDYHIK